MSKKVNVMWQRVHGPDLDCYNAIKRGKNKDRLKSKEFVEICEMCHIEPSKRQASRYNNKRGIVYKFAHNLI